MTEKLTKTEIQAIYGRIKEAVAKILGRQVDKVRDTDIAREFDITPQSVHAWSIGKTPPNRDTLRAFASRRALDFNWLMDGEAPSRKKQTNAGETSSEEVEAIIQERLRLITIEEYLRNQLTEIYKMKTALTVRKKNLESHQPNQKP